MRPLRLPWRRHPDTPDTEPALRSPLVRKTDRELSIDLLRSGSSGRPDGSAAILELIGSTGLDGRLVPTNNDGEWQAKTPHATGDADHAPDVIDGLNAQYWRVLADPHASLSDSWIGQPDDPPEHAAASDTPDDWHAQGEIGEASSVEALLSGERALEDVFGLLERGSAPDLEVERVPEVLRLFAPPEYHAAEAHRAPSLPPALTRREHHVLSVDSPLATPARKGEA
jgi:hypothetical protein